MANEEGDIVEEVSETGTYYMDRQGHYYYQASSESQATLIEHETMIEERGIEGDENVSLVDAVSHEKEIIINDESGNPIQIPGQVYQIVTIVPSEAPSGDISYVILVQQGNEKVQDDNNCEVVQPPDNLTNSDEEDDKSKIVTITRKKSQPDAPAHMCNYCNYTTSKRYLLSRHMKSHSEERPHKCAVCERGFKTIYSLHNHVNTHTGTKPHRCRFCESAFTTSGELVRHVRYRHTHEKPHKCSECNYASVELSKLKRHVRCHTGERPYQCAHCTYASPDNFKLKRHMRTHTRDKPYECEFCKLRFTQSNSLKAHKFIHNIGVKPIYSCELCPTTCGRKTDLRIHIQNLHTSVKPQKCKRCGKSFSDRFSYNIHNKTHGGEKCFKCDICQYASTSQRHLNSHMLIHTDEKPFTCGICERAFRHKQLLKRHQNLHHNPNYVPSSPREKSHKCQECKRQFFHKGNLTRHAATHDPLSVVHKNSLALKLARQKKLYILGGQQVKVIPRSFVHSPNDYILVEVFHVPGENNDTEGSYSFERGIRAIKETDEQEKDDEDTEKERDKNYIRLNTESNINTCFGFDEEGDCEIISD